MEEKNLMPSNEELKQAADTLERFRLAEFGTEDEKLRASLPEYLYHLTTETNVPSILASLTIYASKNNEDRKERVYFGDAPEACVRMAASCMGDMIVSNYWRRQEKGGLLRPGMLKLYKQYYNIDAVEHPPIVYPCIKVPTVWLDPAKLKKQKFWREDYSGVEYFYSEDVELLEAPEVVNVEIPGYTELVFGDRRLEDAEPEDVEETNNK